jgi:hypothetical protein
MNYDEKEDYNFMGSAEETKEQPGENVNITDLMTSSPIMNKKKMLNNIQGLNMESDKLSTFQTPMP